MSAAPVVAIVPVRAMPRAWRTVRAAVPALADAPWPLVEAALDGGAPPSLVARCTNGDAVVVVTDRAMARRMGGRPCVRWAWDDGTGVSVSAAKDGATDAIIDAAERQRYTITVGPVTTSDSRAGRAARAALREALVALGAEVQP